MPPLTGIINSLPVSCKCVVCSCLCKESKRMKLGKTKGFPLLCPQLNRLPLIVQIEDGQVTCCPFQFHKEEELRRNSNKLLKSKEQVSNYLSVEKQKGIRPYTLQERIYYGLKLRVFYFTFHVYS